MKGGGLKDSREGALCDSGSLAGDLAEECSTAEKKDHDARSRKKEPPASTWAKVHTLPEVAGPRFPSTTSRRSWVNGPAYAEPRVAGKGHVW